MARRTSSPPQEALIDQALGIGRAHLAEVGLHRFSMRAVAREMGYSPMTLIAWFGSVENFVFRIGEEALDRWLVLIRERADSADGDIPSALVKAYFEFARSEPEVWRALYVHRAEGGSPPQRYLDALARVTWTVTKLAEGGMPPERAKVLRSRISSILCSVRAHCLAELDGNFDVTGEGGQALDGAIWSTRVALAAIASDEAASAA